SSYLFGYAAPPQVLAGDYNRDGSVNAADYAVWRDTMGQTGPGLAADGTGPAGVPDNAVDQWDYDYWRSHFGAAGGGSQAGSTAVPEPCALYLVAVSLMIFVGRNRR
ncbi:MAG: hypothetical protein AB7U97_03880, partial [Pirellulales bacterium]